ncbi:MAG: manganese transporter [Phycisphaerales bacterium]|nr:MAG: manganese transporter [Phycisphaerales bacterium]
MATKSRTGRVGTWIAAALALVGCLGASASGSGRDDAREPIRVLATTGIIADAASAIGGDRVRVTTLMGPGVDPHLYRPTREDARAIVRADVILKNGFMLEGRMGESFERAARAGRRVVAVAEGLPAEALLLEDEGAATDPHVWMSPRVWAHAVERVASVLIEAEPSSREVFEANAGEYLERLRALDAYASEVLGTIPEKRRVLVTAHDAFGYLGAAYGLEVVGIQGLSTESEAGVRRIERMVSLIVEREVPAVFIETTVTDRNVRALVAGVERRGRTLTIGGELYSDALGEVGSPGETYFGMFEHNIETIARGLGGSSPSGGFARWVRDRAGSGGGGR